MRIKRFAALAMAATMVAATAVGCTSKTSSSSSNKPAGDDGTSAAEVQDVTLKIWAPEEDMEITQKMCDDFNAAHPEFNCTFELAVVGIDESGEQLTTDPDNAADIFLIPSGSVAELTDAGLLYPITYDIDNVKTLYGDGAIQACTAKDGLIYGLPSAPNSWFMYYNKSMYTEDEVKSLEKMMAKDLGDGVANFSCTISNSWYIEAFFYAAGCTLYGEDGTNPDDCTWNNAAGLEAGNYLIDLAANPKYVEDKDGIAGSKMKEGTLGALCSGTWAAAELKEALGDNFGACALPTIEIDGKDCQLRNFADYKCYAIKSSTQYPLAAQMLLEYINNEDNQMVRYNTNFQTPTIPSLQSDPTLGQDEATLALLAQTEFSVAQPAIAQIAEYWTPAQALGEGIINGDITSKNIQESLDTVAKSATTKLTE